MSGGELAESVHHQTHLTFFFDFMGVFALSKAGEQANFLRHFNGVLCYYKYYRSKLFSYITGKG